MAPRIPASHIRSRDAVNSLRTLLESAGHIVEEVPGGSDFGEDLRVTFGDRGERTPYTVSVQVKSGGSLRRRHWYTVPVGSHGDNWAESNLPVACVVHDPEEGALFWANASAQLRHARLTMRHRASVRVPRSAKLETSTLPGFVGELCGYIDGARGLARAVEELCGASVGPRDYVAYAPNIHGEQMVFIQRLGEERSIVLHADLDWEPLEVTEDDLLLPGTEPHRRHLEQGDPRVAGFLRGTPLLGDTILNGEEALWLFSCFRNSAWHRPR